MKKREPISKIMTSDLLTVNLTNSLLDVKDIFEKNKVRHIPVVSGSKIIGLISKTDFYRITYNLGDESAKDQINSAILSSNTIEDVMTKNLETVKATETIQDVAQMLVEREFHAVPVVDGDTLKGIVTTTDIIKYLLEQY